MTAKGFDPWVRSGDAQKMAQQHAPADRKVIISVVNVLLVLSVVPWRSDAIFTGGVDLVVIGKALVALVAFSGAVGIVLSTNRRFTVGLGPVFLAIVGLLVSALGATVAGDPKPTAVLVVRMLLILATVILLLTVSDWEAGIGNLLAAMGVVALVAALTGVPAAATDGRLGGGVPELHPNGLAGLASTPLIGLVAMMLHRGLRLWSAIAALALFGIVIATGSRTALLAVAIALVVAVLVNGIRDRKIVYLLLASLPILYGMATFTNIFTELATRAGSTDATSSLESRFDAWRAVLGWGWLSWQKWIGLGLAVKTVDVDMRWREEQVLDSSWVSILAQVGIFGVLLVALLVAWCFVAACSFRPRRWIVLPLLVLVVFRSITESGLFDSAEPFVVLMVLSAVLTRRSRHGSVRSLQRATGESRATTPALTYDEPSPGQHRRGRSAGES